MIIQIYIFYYLFLDVYTVKKLLKTNKEFKNKNQIFVMFESTIVISYIEKNIWRGVWAQF